jgi:hypothetical protein
MTGQGILITEQVTLYFTLAVMKILFSGTIYSVLWRVGVTAELIF